MGRISQAAKGAAKGAKTATKRMSKAEAEAAGLWHPISDVKLRKPVSEIQRTVVEDPEAQMLERRVITPEEIQGGVAIPLVGDRAAAGRLIQEIEGTPMNVKLEGGPDFMRLHPGMAWASGQGVLTMLADRIRKARESGNPVYGVYTAMGPQAVDFNTMVTESLLNQLDVSGLRKADIKAFNEAVRQVKGQGNKPKAPNFVGIDHPDFERELMEGPGGQRDAFVKTMAKAKFQKAGFPDVAAARTAVTDPELMDIERGSSGFTVARLDPEAGIEEMSGHKTYPFDLRGEYVGGFEQQLPVDVMYPTHFGAKRLMGKEDKDIHKSLELFAPLQYLEQEWLDNAMKYLELQRKIKEGRAEGGPVEAEYADLESLNLDDLMNPDIAFKERYPGQTRPLPSDLATEYNKVRQDNRLKEALMRIMRELPQPVSPGLQALRNALQRRGVQPGDVQEAFGYASEDPVMSSFAEGGLASPEGIPPIATDLEMEFQQYQVGGAVRRAAAAAAKQSKGLGEKAAEAAMKATKTPRDEAIIAARDASKQGFLGPSKEKGVFYHATHEDFSKFRPSHRGAHFVTKDPEFANEFLGIYDEGYEMKPGANIMPVHVQAQNPFDYENPEHIQMVLEKYRLPQGVSPEKVRDNLEVGNWNFIEDRNIQRAIKESGFDSFYVNEYGTKNLGLFEPTQIKSAIGMQGSYDITDSDITKAEGGSVRLSDDIRARLAQKMGFAGGGSVEGWKDRLAKKMAEGGVVKMAEGGDLPQDELAYMAEALSPERESEDSETAKKIRAAIKAGKVIATSLPKALVSPVVGLYGTAKSGKYGTREGVVAGEKAMEEFMEPSEETVKELQADPLAMGYLENVGKFMEELETKYKLPPLMPELYGVATGTRGIVPQVKGMISQGAGKAKQMASEVPALPVGLSMEPVGKPVSQVISEAKPGKIKVEANESGFYSPIEKAVVNLQRKQGPGQAFLSDIMKFNPSKGELEATGIADWLKDQKSVTKQEVMDYINGNKVELVETVRGTVLSDADRQKFNDINRRISRGFKEMITPEEEEFFEATRAKLAEFKEPRFERENLILPGGANYREILLKLPVSRTKDLEAAELKANALSKQAADLMEEWKKASELNPGSPEVVALFQKVREARQAKEKANFDFRELIAENKKNNYESSHWPDDPNTLAHMRVQDMKINGKKTLMIEEIQSDWHQEGREKGYSTAKNTPTPEERQEWKKLDSLDPNERTEEQTARLNYLDHLVAGQPFGVPDAPFKKDWYQLAIKRLFKYAADNDYDQIALVGPEEQIRRGSLGTHIDGLFYEKAPDGSIKLEAEKNGKVVLDKTVKADDLELYVGKDVAKRIIQSDEKDGTLSGDDLKIGGEGMRQYYDRSYPDSMNKIGKKYGAKLEKKVMTINEYGPDDVETVQTGEADRFGREMIAYKVVDPETDKVIAYEYDFDKALKEANKSVPQTSYWLMDLSPDMKKDVKIGQPFKKGGAVKMRRGGPIVSTYDTIPDITDAGQIKVAALEQELRKYA